MTPKQAQKAKRRKARQKKRILNFALFLFLISLGIFLSFKGISGVLEKTSSKGDNLQDSEVIDSDSSNGDSSVADTDPLNQNSRTLPKETDSQGGNTPSNSSSSPNAIIPPAGIITPATKPESTWSTVLVNTQNPLPADFTVEVREIKGTGKEYDTRAADALENMLNDAEAAGFKMYLVSTYRTVAYQQGLYNRKVNEYKNKGYDDEAAKAEAGKWVAVPGTSEHNLGLAADIVSSTWYNSNNDLTQEFENTEHFTWLSNNCQKYGFILRFPKGRESITGIVYEPWHYRYVGIEAAEYIKNANITLEEFNQ